MKQLKPIDVIGPLPVSNAIVVCGAGKTFVVKCTEVDASICQRKMTNTETANILDFVPTIFDYVGASPINAELVLDQDRIYSRIDISHKGKGRLVNESPAMAVISSLYFNIPLLIKDESFDKLLDKTVEYHQLKTLFKPLWPIQLDKKTSSLAVLSDFMESCSTIHG